MMKKLWYNKKFWEIMGYSTLALAIFGQITVGYFYLVAQFAYLASNVVSCIRDFALELPMANKVRNVVFTAITVALIVINIMR